MLPQKESNTTLKIALIIAITIIATIAVIYLLDSQTNSQNGNTNGGDVINGNSDPDPEAPKLQAKPEAIKWGTVHANQSYQKIVELKNAGHAFTTRLNMTIHSIIGLTDPVVTWTFEGCTLPQGSSIAIIFTLTVTEAPEPDWSFHMLISSDNCQLWILNSS